MTDISKLMKKPSFRSSHRCSAGSLNSRNNPYDSSGKIFITGAAHIYDVSGVNIVGAFVDTIRQIYNGVLDEGFLYMLETAFQADELIELKTPLGQAACHCQWHVQKMGKASGYRYKLQNSDVGLVILVGSYYQKAEVAGSHLKIEASPHFLKANNAQIAQSVIDHIASLILHNPEPAGVAIHLAVDLQGWKPAHDHLENFVTYARFVRNYMGLQTAEIGDGFSDVACRYGSGDAETITIGKPTGLQTSIYNKTKQAKVIDKVDYYNSEWSIYSLGTYDPQGQDVYRVEYRFHHSIVRELVVGEHSNCVTYLQASKILRNLWQYAIMRNRLEIEPKLIHPVWQMMFEDVEFHTDHKGVLPMRQKKQDVSAISKNYDLMVGNLISITARQTSDVNFLIRELKKLHFYDDLMRYYRVERRVGEVELRERLKKSLLLRRMLRNAA